MTSSSVPVVAEEERFSFRPVSVSQVKQIWTGSVAQAAARYGEQAPMAAVCCNACRTCVTTNVVAVAAGAALGAAHALARLARRIAA
jgi:hypothetical protein